MLVVFGTPNIPKNKILTKRLPMVGRIIHNYLDLIIDTYKRKIATMFTREEMISFGEKVIKLCEDDESIDLETLLPPKK